jgi:hypothetical protein
MVGVAAALAMGACGLCACAVMVTVKLFEFDAGEGGGTYSTACPLAVCAVAL